MDDITVYRENFEECLVNLETILHKCIEKNLVFELGEMSFYGQPRHCIGAYHFKERD